MDLIIIYKQINKETFLSLQYHKKYLNGLLIHIKLLWILYLNLFIHLIYNTHQLMKD